jgi:uncharacterized membrane protein
MNGITWIHIAGGMTALVAGAVALAVRKGGRAHTSVGTAFCVAMFVLGLTASILSPLKTPAESPIGGLMVCYFVATAWMAARRRNGTPGRFEKIACALGLVIGALIITGGVQRALAPPGTFTGPPNAAMLFMLGGLCLLGGLGDLRFVLRGRLSAVQRLSRHLWRMCFAFFIATGSFFFGQQDVLPEALRGSAILAVLGIAPFPLMLYWLIRVRVSRTFAAQRTSVPVADANAPRAPQPS